MTMKQNHFPATAAAATTTFPTVCGQCGIDAHPFVFHIRHRGLFRRLCTTCALRANSSLFCPTCFQIYDSGADQIAIPLPDTVTCSKCFSNSHSSCVGPNPSKPYICPLCTNHFSPIFNWKNKEIDKKSASALLAAAKISVDTIGKAAAIATAEAEKKAREAASTRKRAKEAIEHFMCVEENSKKDSKGVGLGVGNGQRIGIGGRIVGNVGERNLFGDGTRMDRVDNSSAVLAALNAVELKEKEKQGVVPIMANGRANGVGSEKKPDGVVGLLDVEPVAVVDPRTVVRNNHQRQENGGPYK